MPESNRTEVPEGKLTLGQVERFLMAFSMGLLCLLTMANVLVRYFTDISFAFTEEISVVLLVVMTMVGASHAFATNHHITIGFFIERWPALRPVLYRFSLACSLLMFGLIAWYGIWRAWDDYRFEVTTPSLGFPQWTYTIWLPLLALLIVFRLLQLLRRPAP